MLILFDSESCEEWTSESWRHSVDIKDGVDVEFHHSHGEISQILIWGENNADMPLYIWNPSNGLLLDALQMYRDAITFGAQYVTNRVDKES